MATGITLNHTIYNEDTRLNLDERHELCIEERQLTKNIRDYFKISLDDPEGNGEVISTYYKRKEEISNLLKKR